MLKKIAVNIFTISIAFILVFLFLEMIFRIANIDHPNHHILVDGSLLMNKPSSKYINRKENYNLVHLNNIGFHDYDREYSNQNYRMLVIGDSFVEAAQVPIEEIFTSKLEKEFERENKKVEVIAAGMSGTGVGYQYFLWKNYLKDKLDVDHVILHLYLENELLDNHEGLVYSPINFGVYIRKGGEVYVNKVKYSFFQKLLRTMTSYSAFLNFVYKRSYLLKRTILNRKHAKEQELSRDKKEDMKISNPHMWEESIASTLLLIEKWNREIKEESINFSIVVYLGLDNNKYSLIFLNKLENMADEQNIPFLTLNFDGYTPADIVSFDQGKTVGHYNYLGHDLVAKQLHYWLSSNISFSKIRERQRVN